MADKVRVLRQAELEGHPLKDSITIADKDDSLIVTAYVRLTCKFPKQAMRDVMDDTINVSISIPLSMGEVVAETVASDNIAKELGSVVATKAVNAVNSVIRS